MRCLKSFEERIASRDPDRQTAESRIRIALMNRFNALGQAKIERGAKDYRGKGGSSSRRPLVQQRALFRSPKHGGMCSCPKTGEKNTGQATFPSMSKCGIAPIEENHPGGSLSAITVTISASYTTPRDGIMDAPDLHGNRLGGKHA